MNVYVRLGASRLPDGDWGFNAKCPYVHFDGSPGEGTREWAFKEMGFINTDALQFNSYCELLGYSAVTPFRVTHNSIDFYLHPVNGGSPGDFRIEYGSIGGDRREVNCVFRPEQMEQAILKALEESQSMYWQIEHIATDSPNKDDRFTLDDELGWLYLGVPCDLISIYCVGKPRKFLPRVKVLQCL